ncbi:unnamed protein product [Pneumocystis jirovecii]|uniref:Uncharacterized protein n=1 Tax=Pneumocystis jirovecii TaxID=42068 RepID=L0PGG6_PNEJI|nr:unnamed protein product [Pneumocystis jirovecii]
MTLNNEKNELLQSEMKFKNIAKDLTEKNQALQNHFFLIEQENKKLKSKILEYQKKLDNFKKNTSDIDSIISKNEALHQKINFLKA